MSMTQPGADASLSSEARRVLGEVTAQLACYDEAVRGLCATSTVRHTNHGTFRTLPDEGPEQIEERIDTPEAQIQNDMLPLIAGSSYEREELPASHANELSIRVTSWASVPDDGGEIEGADLMFTREPAQLVQAILHPPAFSGIVGFMVEHISNEVLFGYVNGVPLPVKTRTRMRSRGIGRFRIDQESSATIRYEPCG
ncbi:MAG: hypothetical protein AAGI91_02525 [Bacteroidota bacterium]